MSSDENVITSSKTKIRPRQIKQNTLSFGVTTLSRNKPLMLFKKVPHLFMKMLLFNQKS